MDTNLQIISDSGTAIIAAAAAAQADFAQKEQDLEAAHNDLQSVNQENNTLTQENLQLKDQLSAAQILHEASLDDIAAGRWPLIEHTDLHLEQLIPGTKEVLFKWLQPGNVGNTGGGSALPHGTSIWATALGSATVITVKPVAIDSKQSDDFYYYMLLPFPASTPRRFIWKASNYSCRTAADWANCQALEFQNEIIIAGHVHNMGWQFNPHEKAMKYFNFVAQQWQAFGGIPLPDMGQPCSVLAEFSIDRDAHTTTHEAITLNGTRYLVNVTQPCGGKPATVSKFTTSVQLDCKPNAPSYSALLDGFDVRAL